MNRGTYWYTTDSYICVICMREKRLRKRVYTKEESGTTYFDDMCWEHKMA